MNDFDKRYITKVLTLHDQEMRLDSADAPSVRIWHLLRSLVEYCDAQEPRIDLDELLQDVRDDFKMDREQKAARA